jgi:hypothetical protein
MMPNDKIEGGRELSIPALAELIGKTPQALFQQLSEMGLIVNNNNLWELTPTGKAKGGMLKGDKFAKYIAWPESIKTELEKGPQNTGHQTITATAIGKYFEKPADKINSILSELGLIKRDIKGWQATELGIRLGAIQSKDRNSGVPYVRWPESILSNKYLIDSVNEAKGDTSTSIPVQNEDTGKDIVGFRDKFEAKNRTKDGHYVRSKAEIIIDNWLYEEELVHAYERKIPVEEDIYSDFYIPTGKVYIEYWGLDSDPKYSARKEKKLEIYKKYELKLIQLTDKEVQNLDDTLPRLLLEFGIKTV